MTIAELKAAKESEDRIEFKEAKRNYPFNGGSHTDPDKRRKCVLGYVVALANERGGKLVLGMSDKLPRVVVGSDFAQGLIGNLEDEIYQHLSIRVHIRELFEDGLRVVVMDIPSRPIGRLMKFEGVALMRTGDSLRIMSDDEMYSILQEQEPDYSAKFCLGFQIEDLDNDAIKKMRVAYSKKQSNPSFLTIPLAQALSDLKLLQEGRLNYAALLLLGKKEEIDRFLPQAKITWEFRFTESQIHYDFRETVQAPLFVAIDQIWLLINGKNGSTPIQNDAYIFSVNSFNESVIREALLNSIAHRDYSLSSEIMVKQYPHKIIIQNPGGFPRGVDISNLINVNSTPRCRLMAEVLEKTGLVERSGQGIDKIFAITLQEGKREPDYSHSDPFQVTLHLDGTIEDKAFYIFMTEVQGGRSPDHQLGVDDIVGLYKVKGNASGNLKPALLQRLEQERLIGKVINSNKYTLAERYYQLADREKAIGTRYIVAEVERFVMALQGQQLKIGQLEMLLSESYNRNQIKYLISKLFEDGVIRSTGAGKGTTYHLNAPFEPLRGNTLVRIVIDYLRERNL